MSLLSLISDFYFLLNLTHKYNFHLRTLLYQTHITNSHIASIIQIAIMGWLRAPVCLVYAAPNTNYMSVNTD